jgi:RNA-directed DNA polymerase
MKMRIKAIYETTSLESRHSLRPNKSCHTALKTVSQIFPQVSCFIEENISKCFDNLDPPKLMTLIK